MQETQTATQEILAKILNFQPTSINDDILPTFPYRDNWFERDILLELAYIKQTIEDMELNETLQNFYLVCFSSIIRIPRFET